MYKSWVVPEDYETRLMKEKKYLRTELQDALSMSPSVFSRVFRNNALWLAQENPIYVGQRIIQYDGEAVIKYLKSLENPKAEAQLILDFLDDTKGSEERFKAKYRRGKQAVFNKETHLYFSGVTDWVK